MSILTPKQQEWVNQPGNSYPPQCKVCGGITAWNSSKAEFRLYCGKLCASADKAAQQEKQKQTNRERYGADYAHQTDAVKAKIKQTFDEVYGGHPSTNPDIKQKRIGTYINRYGVDNPRKAEIVKAKIRSACITALGVATPFQLPEYAVMRHEELLARFGHSILYDMYVTQQLPAKAIATELGVDTSTVLRHLRAHNIDINNKTGHSRVAMMWLAEQTGSIQHKHNGGEYTIPGTRYRVDGYDADTNTVYEFYGDFWHGNPVIYDASDTNSVTGTTMGELYQRTVDRENNIRELGYNTVVMWEYDYCNR